MNKGGRCWLKVQTKCPNADKITNTPDIDNVKMIGNGRWRRKNLYTAKRSEKILKVLQYTSEAAIQNNVQHEKCDNSD